MVGSVTKQGRAVRPAEGRQPALPGEGGRLPGPELRTDFEDHRDRDRAARDRSGCSRRMDRAARHAAAAGEGAMNQQWENLNMLKWRLRAAAFVGGARSHHWRAGPRTPSRPSPAANRPAAKSSASSLAEPLSALPNGFTVQAPPRVALDLPGIGNGLGRSTIDINQGNLALGQRGAGRGPHAPGVQPEAGRQLQGWSCRARCWWSCSKAAERPPRRARPARPASPTHFRRQPEPRAAAAEGH